MASETALLLGGERGTWDAVARDVRRFSTVRRGTLWGWFPALCLTCALALAILACADAAGRASAPYADAIFWLGLIVLVVPVAWRLCMRAPTEAERIALLVLLGLALFSVKLLEYPTGFAFFDEFLHWRTAQDIAASGHLGAPNTLLPISPLYPGLEIVTTAVSSLSGLSIFASGMLVLVSARLLLVGSLYLFYRRISGSVRVASVATLFYMANPHFLFFESQFAYESLALPLGAFTLWLVARCVGSRRTGERITFAVLALAAVGALAVTHHISSYATLTFLAVWALVAIIRRGGGLHTLQRIALVLGIAALVTGGVVWLLLSNNAVVGYLAPHVTDTLAQLRALAAGQGLPQHLFTDYAGSASPAWETYAGIAAVVLATLCLPFGLRGLRRGGRPSAAALALAIIAPAYPLSQIFRLSADGMEIADRLPDFLFVAVAYLLALAATRLQRKRVRRASPTVRVAVPRRIAPPVLATVMAVLFIGGVCIGDGPEWMHLPGPALVEADMRSIDAEHIALAEWMAGALGGGHVVAADRDTRLVLATYGDQNPSTSLASGLETSPLFTAPALDDATLALLRAAHVQYLVVDQRLSEALPAVGTYFEQNEPGAYMHTSPLNAAALNKYDGAPGVNRIFDDGELQIYDTSALLAGP